MPFQCSSLGLDIGVIGLTDREIDTLIQQRTAARKAKNWAESDRIRDELKAQRISLIDTKEGTTWHRG